ncbi:hypothetical protein GMLC_16170 [Geomonas limicola]|uniref:Uncharacterized protein n=1 Tax=Geomonas limicola TaxID=2740186 RepID=A0A6V8N648_9BACT|nr:SIR2 family protein [Geomonas limicola]GFO68038.1 hypothetical protein GMLC_16170 [Geomonas limicola]
MQIEDAIRYMLDGRGVLFTGAGFSYGAANLLHSRIPAGNDLAKELIAAAGMRGQADLDRAATVFIRKRTPDELVKLLKNTYTVTKITETHKVLAGINWRRIYTTNYDSVFEQARAAIGKPIKAVTAKDQPDGLVASRDLIVHINGAINTLTKDELFNSFKLTSASYAADSFEESGWAFHFRSDVRNAAVVLFIGYSLYDLDIARVLLAENVTSKAVFVVAPPTEDNDLEADELADFGDVHRIGVDEFARLVQEVSATYVPMEAPLLLSCWDEVEPISAGALPNDDEVIAFVTEGILSSSIRGQLTSSQSSNYVLSRTPLESVTESILNQKKHVILHSPLGCGKSFISEVAAAQAFGAGWKVFVLRSESSESLAEVEEVIRGGGNILLVIESYFRHMKLVRWISEANLDNVTLLLTSRTDVHEIFAVDVSAQLKHAYTEVDCTKLDDKEIEAISALFDKYGLWGQKLSWPYRQKYRYIKTKCAGELPSLLVDAFESKNITEKYREIITSNSHSDEIQRILIALFVLEVMNYNASPYLIQELLGGKNIKWSYIKANTGLKSVVDFNMDLVQARSPVLGLHLLHTLFEPKFLVQTVVQMAKEADDRRATKEFRVILKDLMRFKHIAMILPKRQRLQSTVLFYESIKNLTTTRRDPQFWLQYGIASLTLSQLDRAERYFADAYSLANAIEGYDCFQIDNHYARFLFEKALLETSKSNAMQLVLKARTIILAQMKSEERYYPYRAALGLFNVFDKWKGEWTPDESKLYYGIFFEIQKRCSAAGSTIRNNRYVLDCAEKSKEYIGYLGSIRK